MYCLIYICVAYVGIFAALDIAQYKFDYAQNIYVQVQHIGVCIKLRKLKVREKFKDRDEVGNFALPFILDFIAQ